MFRAIEVVRLQIGAMKSDVFELGLFRQASGQDGLYAQMLPRTRGVETLLHGLLSLEPRVSMTRCSRGIAG